MIRKTSHALTSASLILVAVVSCTSERDRIGAALDRDLADALAGCVPVAWERNPELRIQRGGCDTGRWQIHLPYILDALSHIGRVRVIAEEPGTQLFANGKQYALSPDQPIATSTTQAGTTTVLCWADVHASVVDTGPAEVRDGRLSVDVWFELEPTAPIDIQHLAKRDREILRRNTYWARHLEWTDEQSYWLHPGPIMRTATLHDGDWSFASLSPHGIVTRSTSEHRVIWPPPKPATAGSRIVRVDRLANRYQLFANGFEEGDLSAWKIVQPSKRQLSGR